MTKKRIHRPTLRSAACALIAGSLAAATAGSANAQALTPEQARQLVAPFYTMLTQPATRNLVELADAVIAPDWRSLGSDGEAKTREAFVEQLRGAGKLIPDLRWEIAEILISGNRIVVRGEASGTPIGPFLGQPASGKSFRIMSIDIHTVKDGKLVAVHHVEDWATAVRQLTPR
jgi:predicted ester cyclase